MKIREGRGFTIEELKAAGIRKKEALSIGIAVDHRARDRSEEKLKRNVERLQAYKARLVVFPKNAKKPKKGDSSVRRMLAAIGALYEKLVVETDYTSLFAQAEDLKADTVRNVNAAFPLPAASTHEKPRAITSEEKEFNAFTTLRKERSDARLVGVRAKRAQAKAEAEAAKNK
jgi:large subunit ribosomal protein L13e